MSIKSLGRELGPVVGIAARVGVELLCKVLLE